MKKAYDSSKDALDLMKMGIEFYREGKPIYDWEVQFDEEGNLKEGGPEGKYKIVKEDGTVSNDINYGSKYKTEKINKNK